MPKQTKRHQGLIKRRARRTLETKPWECSGLERELGKERPVSRLKNNNKDIDL